MQPIMSAEALTKLLVEDFPQLLSGGHHFRIDAVESGRVQVTLQTAEHHLRPGGTVSGPSLFALADVAAYLVILAHIGPILSVVTTNMSMNFLTRPKLGDLIGESRLIRLGRRLAVIEISIRTAGEADPCAHAVATYAIPKQLQAAEKIVR